VRTPADITRDGITLSGLEGPDRLQQGAIGERGDNKLVLDWSPTTQDVALYTQCRAAQSTTRYWVRVNGMTAAVNFCSASGETTPLGEMIPPNDSLWLDAPIGRPASFSVELVDERGRPVQDDAAQLALGIYQKGEPARSGPPRRIAPAGPGDYEKDGVRFRAAVAGDTLTAAQVGDRGQGQVSFTFTAPTGPLVLRDFCTANRLGFDPGYQLRISFNGVVRLDGDCSSGTTDAADASAYKVENVATAGRQVVATATLVDRNGRPVSVPEARIGLAVYQLGAQRTVADGIALSERKDYDGYTYQLADVRTADAVAGKDLELATPQGTPFLVAYGSSDLGSTDAIVELSGLSLQANGAPGGISTVGEAARGAGAVSVKVSAGKPTKGKLILALYVPA
jgi:hypothetical protein